MVAAWLASLFVVGSIAVFKLFWDVGLCMDDGARRQRQRVCDPFLPRLGCA
jgi:hypothetical protein